MSAFNGLLFTFEKLLGNTIRSYCDVETSETDTSLVDDLGGFFSVIVLEGSRGIFSVSDLEAQAEALSSAMSQTFRSGVHQLDVVHHHEPYRPGSVGGQINFLLDGQRQAANQIGLQVDAMLTEQAQMLSRLCHHEQTFLVFRTHPSKMAKDDRRYIREARKKASKASKFEKGDAPLPPTHADVQNTRLAEHGAIAQHEAATANLIAQFTRCGYLLRLLTAHEAVAEMRRMCAPERTPALWKPLLPGDKLTLSLPLDGAPIHPGDVLHPSLASQLFVDDLEARGKTLAIGGRRYRGLSMEVPPSDIESFGALQTALLRADRSMPWRFVWRILGAGLDYGSTAKVLLAFLRYVPGPNPRIAKAFEDLKEIFDKNEAIVGFSVDAVTWVDGDDDELLDRRITTLARTTESWGGPKVKDTVGNPIESFTATVPGLRRNSPSPMSAAPLPDAMLMLPLARSSSPWRNLANALFRTPDGKLWPYRAYSPLQNAWITLVFAPMGFGKSVALNALNRGLILDPENTELPMIRMLDVGNSSEGVINMVKYALPVEKRHLVGYFKMSNTREKSMNPFDLPLGFNYPLPSHESFLIELLMTLCTPLKVGESPPQGVDGVIKRIIELAYKRLFSISPRVYSTGADLLIDEGIRKHNLRVDSRTTWVEIRDALFAKKEIHLATIAQKIAVPTLSDVAASAMDASVRAAFGGRIIDGEPMNDYVYRTLTTAIGLYPILSDRTRFDFGDARIVSFDLMEVAIGGTQQADRMTAIMYMIAMRALVAEFAFSPDDIVFAPEGYKQYFSTVVERANRVPKRFVADEFHRTAGTPSARAGVVVLIREGRKWRLETVLASQMLEDFDEAMRKLVTTTLIFGTGNDGAAATAKTFGLGEAGQQLCEMALTGPGPGGSNFIGIFTTKKAKHVALLTLSISPMELWSYNTTAVDRQIRNRLYAVMPVMDALTILSTVFPSGTAADEIERLVNLRVAQGAGKAEAGDFISRIANELIANSTKILRKAGR